MFISPGLLTDASYLLILETRVEKENKNATFPVIIDDTSQNCAGSHPGLLAAAAPAAVNSRNSPKLQTLRYGSGKVLLSRWALPGV